MKEDESIYSITDICEKLGKSRTAIRNTMENLDLLDKIETKKGKSNYYSHETYQAVVDYYILIDSSIKEKFEAEKMQHDLANTEEKKRKSESDKEKKIFELQHQLEVAEAENNALTDHLNDSKENINWYRDELEKRNKTIDNNQVLLHEAQKNANDFQIKIKEVTETNESLQIELNDTKKKVAVNEEKQKKGFFSKLFGS